MRRNNFLYYLLIISIIPIVISCRSSSSKENSSNLGIYVIDVSENYKDKIYFSEYFKSPKTIILETTEKSLIADVQSMQVTDEYIFIMDGWENAGIFMFDKEGKFIHRIGRQGKGPGEHSDEIFDFTLDIPNKEIYILDSDRELIHRYNYETGKFINSISFDEDEGYPESIQMYNSRLYTDIVYYDSGLNKPVLQELDKNTGKQRNTFLDYTKYNKGLDTYNPYLEKSSFYCRTYGNPKFAKVLMDTILCFGSEGFYPYLVIKEKNWVTYKEVKKYKEKAKLSSDNQSFLSLMVNDGFAFNITNYIECEDLILFSYYKQQHYIYVLFNKKNNTYEVTKGLMNDFTYTYASGFLEIVCSDEKGIYDCMTGIFGLSAFKYAVEKGVADKELDKYNELINLDENANPIIFYYERK